VVRGAHPTTTGFGGLSVVNVVFVKIGMLFLLLLITLFMYFGHNIERERHIQKLEPHKNIRQIRKESFDRMIIIVLVYIVLAFQEEFKLIIQFLGIIKK
jgi:hypothetical protein